MIKGLIWHMSLTSVYTECPYCKSINMDDARKGICKCCGNVIDLINVVEKKSKDLLEVESLGLHGAVYKDEKGNWKEWQDPYRLKEVL